MADLQQVTAMAFLGAYPVLVVADVTGMIRGWLTRPAVMMGTRPAFTTYNSWVIKEAKEDEEADVMSGQSKHAHLDNTVGGEVMLTITVMIIRDIKTMGRIELFTGDELGVIKR